MAAAISLIAPRFSVAGRGRGSLVRLIGVHVNVIVIVLRVVGGAGSAPCSRSRCGGRCRGSRRLGRGWLGREGGYDQAPVMMCRRSLSSRLWRATPTCAVAAWQLGVLEVAVGEAVLPEDGQV